MIAVEYKKKDGQLHLSSGFAWIGTYYAMVAFGTATIVEVLGYYGIAGLVQGATVALRANSSVFF